MRIWLIFVLVTLSGQLPAQLHAPEVYRNASHIGTSRYQLQPGQIALPTRFGKAIPRNPEILQEINATDIKQVDLVFSDFPKGHAFNGLNTMRLAQLEELLPGLFTKKGVKWRMIRQTSCSNRAQAEALFHGFVFSLQETSAPLEVDYQKNLDLVKEAFFSLPPEDRKFLSMGTDTLAYDILDRNMYNWRNVTIVSDWTASMYPFTTQILRWHIARSRESNISNFVFFNDGDTTESSRKVVGETGGIYSISATDFKEVVKLMRVVMENGHGDDLPENDLEAVLYAINKFPASAAIVLIADNKSRVRDMELLEKIDRPVHVVLGRLFMDNVAYLRGDYLRLAVKTGGSLHTRHKDYNSYEELFQLRNDILQERHKLRQQKAARRHRQPE